MQKWFYLDDPVYMLTRNYVERHSRKDLEVLSLYNVMCPLHGHTLVIPDGRTHFPLLLLLSETRCLLEEGVGISSTEVAEEATCTLSTPETMGVASADGRTYGPFPMIQTPFLPIFAKGSSFLDLILAYMSLLNLVVISKKKKKEKLRNPKYTREDQY